MITAIVNGEISHYDDQKYRNFQDFYEDNKIDGKVLVELIVNDKEVPVSKLDEIFTATFEGGERVEMAFEELIPFTLNLLSNLMVYFTRFEDALSDFAKNIRSGNAESIDGLKNLQEGLKALEVMKTNLFVLTGTHEGDFLELEGQKEKLQQTLENINLSIDRKDWTELSQLIEYDLLDAVKYYKILFNKAEELLKQKRS